jgi:prepilin-type processing-associated H-X9-DG protein
MVRRSVRASSPLCSDSIRDGTSNTFMIGEDIPSENNWSAWAYANATTATCAIPPNAFNGNPGDWPNNYSFHSKNTNGLQFALADGHVAFITNSIALTTYRWLGSMNGGEVISLP